MEEQAAQIQKVSAQLELSKPAAQTALTDVDRWADARRLRINGKPCSKAWRCLNLPARLLGSR
jgi:hypothetical protein